MTDEHLDVTAPGGWKASLQGRELLAIIFMVIGFLGLAFMLRDHDQTTDARVVALTDEHRALVCVLALPQTERPQALMSANGPCTYLVARYGGVVR